MNFNKLICFIAIPFISFNALSDEGGAKHQNPHATVVKMKTPTPPSLVTVYAYELTPKTGITAEKALKSVLVDLENVEFADHNTLSNVSNSGLFILKNRYKKYDNAFFSTTLKHSGSVKQLFNYDIATEPGAFSPVAMSIPDGNVDGLTLRSHIRMLGKKDSTLLIAYRTQLKQGDLETDRTDRLLIDENQIILEAHINGNRIIFTTATISELPSDEN